MSIFTIENGFVEKSGLGYHDLGRKRLNERFKTFMQPIAGRFEDKRVLDLASHDGRWSFAALHMGAERVTGIEFRQSTMDKSHFILKGDMAERSHFINGNIFDVMPQLLAEGEKFDIVLCLGIFYHIMDHHRLVRLMTAFAPELIVMDTTLVDKEGAFIRLHKEKADSHLTGAPEDADRKSVLIGTPSRQGMEMMANDFGYGMTYVPWKKPLFGKVDGLGDYYAANKVGDKRFSFYLEPDPKVRKNW